MSGIFLSNKKSDVPYIISELDIQVYSIEEISYFVFHHTNLIGKEFFNEKLLKYIRENLKLYNIAEKLEFALLNGVSLPDLICLILLEPGYYKVEDIMGIQEKLPILVSKSTQERIKAKADLLCEYKRYESALAEYYRILEMKREPRLSSSFYAEVVSNIGTIFTKLQLFEEAEKYFKKAYELSKEERYLEKLVFLGLLSGSEQRLLGIIVRHNIADEFVNKFSEKFDSIKKEVVNSQKYRDVIRRIEYQGGTSMEDYYDRLEELVSDWKREYREMMV